MPQQDPNTPPESIVFDQFSGLKNTLTPERLGLADLVTAVNVDIDDAGQIHRRRGYKLVDGADYHSLHEVGGKVYAVRDGELGIVRPDYSFVPFGITAGGEPVAYTTVAGDTYFSCDADSGVLRSDETILSWGHTDGQGLWLSPVYTPTETLGEVGGSLLGDPPKATHIEAYKGRIYLSVGKLVWATELFRYHYIDRTRNFMQFEHDVTLLMAVDDGLYVGTTDGLYFIQGVLGSFKLQHIADVGVLPGSGAVVPIHLVHPQARSQEMPTGTAAVFTTTDGVMAGFNGGESYNLTQSRVIFPHAVSASALFRQERGANAYVAAMDSVGGPTNNARIGDYADAEIVRGGGQ